MANVLLGVTGSVAAIHTPLLFDALSKAGHEVKIVATKPSLYFFDVTAIASDSGRRNRNAVVLDEDEWPGEGYQRGDAVLHIELRRWAEILVIAPLDANTLAKFACGLADNCLTCVWRAWDHARPVMLAPAMNTLMWEHPVTARHFRQLAADFGLIAADSSLDLDASLAWINEAKIGITIVPPISKRLACDDVGVGAMAERAEITNAIHHALNLLAP
ncbi:MAG: phosphopantothenoylcysteine decarboxylase [Planctomycetes bacterium]|nr:phosphopantothenoylcysteine decarboxylase [Planctomycetota bacterium]